MGFKRFVKSKLSTNLATIRIRVCSMVLDFDLKTRNEQLNEMHLTYQN